jgi:hypothetical protein
MDAMIIGSDEEFVEFLVGHVKEEQPELEEENDDETLKKRVRGGVERAKSRGFRTAEDLTIFVSLMFRIAPNFDEQSDIKAILNDKNIPPGQRFEKMQSPTFPKKAWSEAAKNYDENAWLLKSEESTANHLQE